MNQTWESSPPQLRLGEVGQFASEIWYVTCMERTNSNLGDCLAARDIHEALRCHLEKRVFGGWGEE
jgi:hypothetical protein